MRVIRYVRPDEWDSPLLQLHDNLYGITILSEIRDLGSSRVFACAAAVCHGEPFSRKKGIEICENRLLNEPQRIIYLEQSELTRIGGLVPAYFCALCDVPGSLSGWYPDNFEAKSASILTFYSKNR